MQLAQHLVLTMVIFAAMVVAVLDQHMFVMDIATVEMDRMKLTAVSKHTYVYSTQAAMLNNMYICTWHVLIIRFIKLLLIVHLTIYDFICKNP